ncbi:MAG: hypothetical protein QNJ62_14355 [Methyloceanibacter sp.]|nr:hypothetical protein [Methyloceanibacter sp.]
MRLVLLVIVIAAIMALIQSHRHGCTFGSEDWFSCVVDNTAKEYYSAAPSGMQLVQADAARASLM